MAGKMICYFYVRKRVFRGVERGFPPGFTRVALKPRNTNRTTLSDTSFFSVG